MLHIWYNINIYDIIYSVSLFIFRQEVFSHRQMIKIKSVEFSKLKKYRVRFLYQMLRIVREWLYQCLRLIHTYHVVYLEFVLLIRYEDWIKLWSVEIYVFQNWWRDETTSSLRHRYADDVAHYEWMMAKVTFEVWRKQKFEKKRRKKRKKVLWNQWTFLVHGR